jgi:hypothetical protein
METARDKKAGQLLPASNQNLNLPTKLKSKFLELFTRLLGRI